MGSWFKEESQAKRAGNRENSAKILESRNVPFLSMNSGAHLIVSYNCKTADFWPGTGKYQVRGTGEYRRGVFRLLKDLGVPA